MRVIFTHVPKTAGSSVHEGVYSVIGPDKMHVVPTVDDNIGDLASKIHQFSYVSGHIRFPIAYPLFGESIYIAALRDPIERILSHYFFVVREKGFDYETEGPHFSFERFYQTIIVDANRLNNQCVYFSDDRKASSALEVIRRHYSLVWDTSETDRVWPSIGALFLKDHPSFPIVIRESETTQVPPMWRRAYEAPIAAEPSRFLAGERPECYRDFLKPETIRKIEEENAEDMQLYAWMKSHGGIYFDRNRFQSESLELFQQG